MWVSRFLTSNQSKGPKMSLIPLVDKLLEGHKIPLAEYLLGLLYNAITNLQKSWFEGSPKNVSGPLWFLRLWGAYQFKDFLGLTIPPMTDPVFSCTLANIKFPSYSLDRYLKFFMSITPGEGPNPGWHYDYRRLPQICFQTMANLNAKQPLLRAEARIWSRFLTARLLFPGGTYPQSSSDPLVHLTVEYNPHFFAVSFGLSQGLPRVLRHGEVNAENIRLVKNQTLVDLGSHTIRAFDLTVALRRSFTKWWTSKARPKLFPDPLAMISRAVRPPGWYLPFSLLN